MDWTADSFADQIPFYLTQEEKVGLVTVLKNWPNPMDYYIQRYPNEVLQGDAWTKLPIRSFSTGELGRVDGIVLSNSCSVDPENNRDRPQKITMAPLVNFDAYKKFLEKSGADAEQLAAKVKAIKEQRIHNVFYLPAAGEIETDKIAFLDDLHSFPANQLDPRPSSNNSKLVTLSMVGFYLFVFKLSIHFCRLHENVERRDEVVGVAAR